MATRDATALETRRVLAVAAYKAGMRRAEIARKYGVSRTSVGRWTRRFDLTARKATGRPRRVSMAQLRSLYEERPVWNVTVFRDAICNNFGVEYDVDHCSRLLKQLRDGAV